MFRNIDSGRFNAPKTEFTPGPAPSLQWIEIEKLVVDSRYQRDISKRGAINVGQIAEHFEWSKFAPVIVAAIEGGQFAIVDGQHRTTAAKLRGLKTVPCQQIQADLTKQAEAYAAVNGNVTKTSPQQLYHAKLAAKDADALALQDVLASAEVRIVRTNLTSTHMQVGDTQAIGALRRCFAIYGRETLITALQCITQTGNGNPGFVRATIIEALCSVLHVHQEWRDCGDTLLRAMDKFSFPDAWEEVSAGRDLIFPKTAVKVLTDKIRKFLTRKLGTVVKEAAE